jgi:hypothetical protein
MFVFIATTTTNTDDGDDDDDDDSYSLLLALAMPFVSPERIVTTLSATGRALSTPLGDRPTLRRLWLLAAAIDVAARVVALRRVRREIGAAIGVGGVPRAVRDVGALVLAPLGGNASLRRALRVARVARLVFEICSVVRLLLLLHQATSEAGRRATAALRRSFRFQSSSSTTTTTTTTEPATIANQELTEPMSMSSTSTSTKKIVRSAAAAPNSENTAPNKQQKGRRLSALGLTAIAATATAAAAYASRTVKDMPSLMPSSLWPKK